ncbi:MAG TPA: glycosyltransferase family 4 protein [Vicinamibacterales bacterium]|nr:glycosyltransferase family 4 protein [Vicinamibacterales bacterium]
MSTAPGRNAAGLRVAVLARAVFPLHGHGGLERHVYDLVRHLARAGVEVTLITKDPARPGARSADCIDPGIRLRTIPYWTFPFAGRRGTTVLDRSVAYPLFGELAGRLAWELVQEGRVDLVHGLGASVLGYARRRARAAAPLVLNPQGLEEFGATDPARARLKRALYLPLRRAVVVCAKAADRVIATDRALEPAVRRHLRVPADRVCVIPNAIDLEWLDSLVTDEDAARVRATAGVGPRDTVLLSVGRIEANKGFHVLADALAALRLHSGLPGPCRWVIVGDGPYRPTLQRRIAASGLESAAFLAGRLDDRDLHGWYRAASLFVHPTLYEGSSLVTLEAMAHRKAVVATTAGGIPDKVTPGTTGWLVAPGDASALAAALSAALASGARLGEMGEAGRRVVEREFSWTHAAAATIQLYRDLLE